MHKQRTLSLRNLAATQTNKFHEGGLERKTKLLPTIAERRDIEKMQAKQLGQNINKFQHAVSKPDPNQQELIRNAYYIIKNFAQIDSNFKHVFAGLQGTLKEHLFIHDYQICSHYKLREGCSFKRAIKMVDRQSRQVIAVRGDRIGELQDQLRNIEDGYKELIQSQRLQILQLKEDIQRLRQMANTEYVLSLQRKVHDLKEVISNQQDQYKVLAKKNQQISLELLHTSRALQNEEYRTSDLQAKVYDLNVSKQTLQICLLKIRDRFEQLSARMESIKPIIQKVEHQNELLVSQRAKLVNRAAVAFEDLTPRSNYANLLKLPPNTNFLPSTQIVGKLIQELPVTQQFCQKYFVSKRNRKLLECEAIRQQTIEEIQKTKRGITNILP